MGKLEIKVELAPVKVAKNDDLFTEIGEAFNGLKIGESFVITNEQVPSTTLVTKVKNYITLKEGEDIKLGRIYGADDKLSAIRLIKINFKPRKPKTESQGEDKEA